MRKLLATIAIMSLISAPFSFAQTVGADASSGSGSNASSTSGNEVGSSRLNANINSTGGYAGVNATINNVLDPAPADPPAASGDPTNTTNVHYSGSETIDNVPAQASLIESPTAPCMVPIGATFSVAGFGGGAVGAYTSQTCETLERVRMTWNMNQPDVATMMMCQFADYRNARAAVGKPCPDPNATLASAAPATAAAVQPASMQVAEAAPPPPSPLASFCSGLNPNNPEDRPYLASDCAGH